MSEFLKKIVPPPEGGGGKKVIVEDIIPKRKLIEPHVKKIEKRGAATEKTGTVIEVAREKTTERPLTELPVKKWQPATRPFLAFRGIKISGRFLVGAGVAALVIFFVILSTAFARLDIVVRPVSAKIAIPALAITADTKILAINADEKKIPALKIAIEKTYQEAFSSSGKKYIETLARGRIEIFNAFSSAPQVLIGGTRFTEPSGKVFKLLKTITIPGAKIEEGKIIPSSIGADIAAEKAGEDYNIAPADFAIPGFKGTPKFAAFYAKSDSIFSGGFKGEARVVNATDIKNAQEKVSQTLFNQLKAALQEKLPSDDEFMSLDGSRSILIEEVKNPKADERLDTFPANAAGRAEMIIFRKSDLLNLLARALLSPERPSTILADSFKPNYKNVRLDTKNGQLAFNLEGEALAVRIIPADEIKSASVSKTTAELESYLRNRTEIEGFVIKNFPPFRWRTPVRPEAIEVRIELPKGGG